MTRRALFATVTSVAGLCFTPALIRMKRNRQRCELEELRAYGQARLRERLRTEGFDLDRMTEDELMEYVDRVIHEYRQEKRNEQHS